MMQIGTACMMIAGRDAGKRCIVLSPIENNQVLIDGETRRRTVSVRHIEPIYKEPVSIKENASHADVEKACKTLKWTCRSTKPKKAAPRPKRIKAQKTSADIKQKTRAQRASAKKARQEKAQAFTKKAAQKAPETPAKKAKQ